MDRLISMPDCKRIIFEIDDITDDRWRETKEYLYRLQEIHPDLKVTLWVIPAYCTELFYNEIGRCEWIEWGYHGETHWKEGWGRVEDVGGECDKWLYGDVKHFIIRQYPEHPLENFNCGFKAPWYYIKREALRGFRDSNLFVAIHRRYTTGIPEGLKVYDFADYKGNLRLHMQDSHFDGIRENFDRLKDIFNKDTVFEFVSQNLKRWKGE